jgi:DNA-binding HxlR family transcriptional regulator
MFVLMRYAVHSIEGTYACQTLLYLRENPNGEDMIHITMLQRELGASFATIQSRTNDLVEAGLIEKHFETERPFRLYFTLTPTGEMVADHLAKIEALLNA